MVRPRLRRPEPGAGRRLAFDQGGTAHADRRADRLGQDARRFSGGDRRSRPAGGRGNAARRDPGRLRLPLEGAVERHPSQSRGAARRCPARTRADGRPGRRHPHACAHRRHERHRSRPDAPQAAAYSRHHARVALCAARLRIRPQRVEDRPHLDRRRDPCGRAEQARRASRAVARTAGGAHRRPAAADRAFRDAKSDRRGGAPPLRRRRERRPGGRGRDRRFGPPARPRPCDRDARRASRSRHVERGLDPGLRPARGPHSRNTAPRWSSSTRGA